MTMRKDGVHLQASADSVSNYSIASAIAAKFELLVGIDRPGDLSWK
jgi:hypothetical protein